jgi:Tfp pilus assembly protein PilF
MITQRNLGMCSSLTLFGFAALLALAIGCATAGGAGAAKPGALPDEEEEGSPGKKSTGGLSGPVEVPIIARKPTDRQVTEEDKADYEKAVADYIKAKKAGTIPGEDCSKVASAFRKLADRAPALLEARSNEAAVDLECGKKGDAVGIWKKLAAAAKPFAPALANLGYVSWQEGNKSDAESLFKRSIEADPWSGSIAARINTAQIYRERARLASGAEKKSLNDAAVKELRRVLALDGNSLQAYAGLCFIYFDLDLPEAAKLVGAQAIKRAQEIATGKFEDDAAVTDDSSKKAKKVGKGKKDEAKEKEADKTAQETPVEGTGYTVEMKKAVAVVYNTLGMIYLAKKNYTEAIKNFTVAVESDPTLFEARLNLAAVSLKFRNYDIAEENFRAVLKAKPRNYEAIIGLGVALRGNRKLDEAEAKYNEARSLDPQRPDSYFNLGLLYQEYKGGSDKPMLQKAQSYYRDFLTRAPSPKAKKDAEKRIKDIDEVFVALEEAAKMMKEAEEMQRKAEAQQKKMEEEMKKMEEEEKRQQEQMKKQEEDDKKKKEEDKVKKAADAEKAVADKAAAAEKAAADKAAAAEKAAADKAAAAEKAAADKAAAAAKPAADKAAAAAKPAADKAAAGAKPAADKAAAQTKAPAPGGSEAEPAAPTPPDEPSAAPATSDDKPTGAKNAPQKPADKKK